jgi:hypothetical protein
MQREEFPEISTELQDKVKQYLAERLSGDLTIRVLMPLALLWHDAGKPLTRVTENGSAGRIGFLGHERQSARLASRALKDFQAGVAVTLHALADHQATYRPGSEPGQLQKQALLDVAHKLISAFFEQRDGVIDPPPLLTGHDLIDLFGLGEGRLIGLLLGRLKEAQAIGQVEDRAAAVAFIKNDPDFIKNRSETDVGA